MKAWEAKNAQIRCTQLKIYHPAIIIVPWRTQGERTEEFDCPRDLLTCMMLNGKRRW